MQTRTQRIPWNRLCTVAVMLFALVAACSDEGDPDRPIIVVGPYPLTADMKLTTSDARALSPVEDPVTHVIFFTTETGETITFEASVQNGVPPYTYEWVLDEPVSSEHREANGMRYLWGFSDEATWDVVLTVYDASADSFAVVRELRVQQPPPSGTCVVNPDRVSSVPDNFAEETGTGLVAISGSEGTAIVNTPGLICVNVDLLNFTQNYGALGMRASKNTDPFFDDIVFSYGPDFITFSRYVPDNNSFGVSLILQSGTVTDASAYDNDPTSDGIVFVNASSNFVVFMETDGVTSDFNGTLQLDASNFPGVGELRTSFARDDRSNVTAAIAPVATDPGILYFHPGDNATTPATNVGSVGPLPGLVRAVDDVVVVTDNTEPTLYVFTWDASNNVTGVGTVPTGKSSDLDIRKLAGGDLGVVSLDADNDSFWITVLSPTGATLSNTEYALSIDCKPTGCAWLDDNTVISVCNQSGDAMITTVGP